MCPSNKQDQSNEVSVSVITCGHIVVDQRCREIEGKAKIEGYISISDEEAHQHTICFFLS